MCRARPFSRSSSPGSRSGRRPRVGPGEASGRGREAPWVAACGERAQFLPVGPSPVGRKPLTRRRGRCAAGGIPGSSTSPAREASEPSLGPKTAPLSPRRLPASQGAHGSRVPAAASGPELLRGRNPRSHPAPGPPCASPAPRARLPTADDRAAAPAGEMRPLEAPSDGDTGPPRLLAPPAAPSAARGPGDTKRGGLAVCPRSAGAAQKLGLGVNCTRAASLIHVSGVKEPRFPTLGGRKFLYKCFVVGVLSPAKIRWLVI